MSKFIIVGDPHVGKGTSIGKPGAGKDLNSRIKDQLYLLDWVRQQAIDNDVRDIIITGDVYEHHRPHPSLISFFMEWLKRCEKDHINVHIIAGNHDIIRTGSYVVSALDIVSSVEMTGAKVYKDVKTLNFDGVSVTLVPYRDRRMYEVETTEEALGLLQEEYLPELSSLNSQDLKVLVGHLALEGSIHIGDEIDDELNEIFCASEVFKDWDYTWMGHVHNPQVMHKKTKEEPYYTAHIGSMERSDFHKNEMRGRKFIVLFDTDDKELFKEIDIPNRTLDKITILVPKGKDTTDFIINHLSVYDKKNSLDGAIINLEVKLSQDVPNSDREKVLEHIYKKINAHYVCYFSESRVIDNVMISSESTIDSSMTPEASINSYWNTVEDLDPEDIARCKALAHDINKEYEESLK